MKKNVIISVSGAGGALDNQPDGLELITQGEYTKIGQAYCVKYDESVVTGMEGTTTILHVDRDKVTLTRSGTVNSQFVFEKGRDHLSHYDIQEGAFTIGVFTKSMKVDVNDAGGNIKVGYHIRVNGDSYTENDFSMNVKEVMVNR